MANVNPEVISPPDSEWRDYIQRGCERGVQNRIIESWQRCGKVIGTNAPSLALITREPVVVTADEHYTKTYPRRSAPLRRFSTKTGISSDAWISRSSSTPTSPRNSGSTS